MQHVTASGGAADAGAASCITPPQGACSPLCLRTRVAGGDCAIASGVAPGGGCNCNIGPPCYNCPTDSAYSDATCTATWVRTHDLHVLGLIHVLGLGCCSPNNEPLQKEEFRVATCSPFYVTVLSLDDPSEDRWQQQFVICHVNPALDYLWPRDPFVSGWMNSGQTFDLCECSLPLKHGCRAGLAFGAAEHRQGYTDLRACPTSREL